MAPKRSSRKITTTTTSSSTSSLPAKQETIIEEDEVNVADENHTTINQRTPKRSKTATSSSSNSTSKPSLERSSSALSSNISSSSVDTNKIKGSDVGRIEYRSHSTQRSKLFADIPITTAGAQRTRLIKKVYGTRKPIDLAEWRHSDADASTSDESVDNRCHLYAFGSGDMAQLGLTSDVNMRERKKPTLIKSLMDWDIVTFACGALHNAAIASNGAVFTWGCNDDNALGRVAEGDAADDDEHEFTPAPVSGVLGEGVDSSYSVDDELREDENDIDDQYVHPQQVIQVACGASHTIALTASGRVYTWGTYRDANGILGFDPEGGVKKTSATSTQSGDSASGTADDGEQSKSQSTPYHIQSLRNKNIIQIAAGEHHDLALSSDGIVYQWGDIGLGQRSAERRKLKKLVPTAVSFAHIRQPSNPFIVAIFAGGHTSFAEDVDGNIYAWGPNNYGQLGIPITQKMKKTSDYIIHQPTKVQLPASIYNDTTTASSSSSTSSSITSSSRGMIDRIACHIHHTLFLTSNGNVYSVGRAEYGRLGIGDKYVHENRQHYEVLQRVDLLNDAEVLNDADQVMDIACGEGHSMAVTLKGKLYTWGSGELCQLGSGGEEDINTPTLVTGQQLIGKRVLQARGGSQHTIILAGKSNFSPYTQNAAPTTTTSSAATNGTVGT